MLKPRARKVKILATLGPASSTPEMIRALMEAGADAVIGVDLDYEVLGKAGSMLMVSASGTAVKLG